jgi:hypothetical protein
MKKEQLIAQLEGAKELTSVVSIDNVIALIQSIEPVVVVKKEVKLTPEFAEKIANKIERTLDCNSRDLVDLSSAEFELNWDNRIELNRVDVNVYEIMEHVNGALEEFVVEEEEEEEEEEDGLIQAQNEAAEELEAWIQAQDKAAEEGVLRDTEE